MKKQLPSRICISMDLEFEAKLRLMAAIKRITLSKYVRRLISEGWKNGL